MSEVRLTTSLQESVLTLLCMDTDKGAIAAGIVDDSYFEKPYNDIARRALEYRKRFKEAPGEAHLDDLFDHVLSDPKNKQHRLYQQILGGILDQASGLNAVYVLSRITEFMRRQNLNASILEAAERFARGGDDAMSDAENILLGALKFRPDGIERGIYLSDQRSIEWMTKYSEPDVFLGIHELDTRNIGLYRAEAMGFLAPQGRGKTWACIHAGVATVMQGKRALHVSLEMKDERVMPRYLRRLFAVAKKKEKYRQSFLQFDDLKRVVGIETEMKRATLTMRDHDIERRLAKKMTTMGTRLDRLHFKSFPTGKLTMGMLTAYMDNLEASDGFVPDVLILDYPKLMRLDRRQDLRIGLGMMMEELRGLCAERNMAGFFPMQANREAEDLKLVTAKSIGEDYSLTQTVDTLITYNRTAAEKQLNLARLFMAKARNEDDGFSVLITQDYETGQFVRQSAYMPNDYFSMVKGSGDEDDINE